MANPTEGDTMVLYLGLLAPGVIALIAGLVIHSFIIGVNVNDWMRGRSVTPVYQVITSLGISRICAQCAVTICSVAFTFFRRNLILSVAQDIMGAVYVFFLYANFWLTSLLSVVFCVKISSLRTRLFLYLRSMIEHRTAHLIVVSGLLAAVSCLLPLSPAINKETKGGPSNTTMDKQFMSCYFINYMYSHAIGAFIPLLFCSIFSVVLLSSLYHHTTKMKMSGNLSINLETYYSTMKFVSFTFIYNALYVTGHFVTVMHYYLYCMNLPWPHIVLGSLPVLHSAYLIYRTAKLRSQMSKVLHNVTDFLFQRKDPETREDIEVVAQRGE